MADKKLALIDAHENTTGVVDRLATGDGRIRSSIVHWSKLGTETDGDQIFLMPVKASDRIVGIYRKGAALTGASDINIGLWSAAATPADVDENLLGDAVSIASAVTVWTQIDEIGNADVGKPLWSLLGLTEVIDKTYYLALNLVTGGTATGEQAIRVDFLI